ncbi:hypothetical protein H2248_007089 [Termitomyces sp. 'cryptogamus']|nr:hypothetical protein H2248_007089 [Termitomyces sp. 'cryptogamus']
MRSWIFVLTGPVAIAAWIIALVSQSIVTAQIGNTFVGPLWFAAILQLLVLLGLAYALRSTTPQSYHPTLTPFSTLIVVFAVLGVNTNIFTPQINAQKALSASWLVLAIVNLLWLVYFTTDHPVSRAPSYGLTPRSQDEDDDKHERKDATPLPRTSQIPSVPTNIDASNVPSRRTTTARTSTTTSTPSSHGNPRNSRSTTTPTNSGPRATPRASLSVHDEPTPDPGPTNEPNEPPHQQYLWHAEALYDYAAAAHTTELSFKQGEVLDISDKSGKWWVARTADGRVGIVPSNYVRLV